MGAQEVPHGIQIGSVVLGNEANRAVSNGQSNMYGDIPVKQTPVDRSRIMSMWLRDTGTKMFIEDLQKARQKVLTAAQNCAARGMWNAEDVKTFLIQSYTYDMIIKNLEDGVELK